MAMRGGAGAGQSDLHQQLASPPPSETALCMICTYPLKHSQITDVDLCTWEQVYYTT
jgi:hypothetical protein